MKNTIHGKWVEFQNKVIPPNASPTQRKEMGKAFYAGIYAYMQLQLANAEASEEAYMEMMATWEVEVATFALQQQQQEAKNAG